MTVGPAATLTTTAAALEVFLKHCHRKHYKSKATIIRQGDKPAELYYVLSGSVSVLVEDHKGREVVLAYLNAGDFFGEMGFFNEHMNRTALVRSRSPCEVAIMSYETLRGLTEVLPNLLFAMSSQLAVRLRKMNRKFTNLALMDVSGRVARTLLDLCSEPDAMTHPEGVQIRITRQELGRIVGCSREMVGRVLKDLEDEHIISVHGKTIVVHRAN